MPNFEPMGSGFKEGLKAKVITQEETPLNIADYMQVIRQHGSKYSIEHWNEIVDFIQSVTKGKAHTGNDYLSMTGTWLTYFIVTWLVMMKKIIADQDDAGVNFDDLIEPIFEGVKYLAKTGSIKYER